MSLVKISQFTADSVPSSLRDKAKSFVAQYNGRPLSKTNDTTLLFAFDKELLVGFAEIKLSTPVAILRNIVVDFQHREKHLGTKLLRTALMRAVVANSQRVQLACKDMHIGFFKHGGFTVQEMTPSPNSESYFIMENPCPALYLSTTQTSRHSSEKPIANSNALIVGEDSNSYRYHNESKYLHLHHRMLSQAHKEIWILADNIVNPVLSDDYTSQCLIRLIKRNPSTDIRILLSDDKLGAGHYNPVLNTIQRLSSYIEVRSLQSSGTPIKEMMTIVDYSASIFRKNRDSCSGFAHFHNRMLSQRLRETFEQHWQFAKPSMQLRRLVM